MKGTLYPISTLLEMNELGNLESLSVVPYEHAEDDVARDDVGVVEAAAHVVQRIGEVLARVRLAQLAKVRQELLLHVNPESSRKVCIGYEGTVCLSKTPTNQ